MTLYIIFYILGLSIYFLNRHFYSIINQNALSTYNTIPLIIYANAVYIAITVVVILKVYLTTVLKGKRAIVFINMVFVIINTVIYIFIQPNINWMPDFLTLIWIADVINLVISIRGRKNTGAYEQ